MPEPQDRPIAGSPDSLPVPRDPLVVALGASAGGIHALKDFFHAVAPDSGMAYVVILHLSPHHESSLAEVLQTSSAIPVKQVHGRTRLEADHAYVVPPNKKLAVVDGHVDVSDMVGVEERRAPIDIFFRTLAEAKQSRAVSVILSGTGADGSMGMKRVKECGGLCIAQDPAEAEFADMPRSAIVTDLVDHILPAAAIPARLAAYLRSLGAIVQQTAVDPEEQENALLDVFLQLRVRTGHDFSSYKRSTVLRRIERRMAVRELASLPDYAKCVRENRDEARALLKDLLISVTNFFRDPEAFAALEKRIVPRLFENKGPQDHVRVWIAGCATGEEAYSVAMLLAEQAIDAARAPSIQVFATDIDEAALAKARAGLYTVNDAADVPPERLRRFFVKDGDAFRVRRELREMVLFAAHNVVKDPPFSHLDLVSCRNLLIYLNRQAQERILKLFHFGLEAGGYLFLGTSESAEDIGNLFVAVDKDHRIYQSRGVDASVAIPPVVATPVPLNRADGDMVLPEMRMRGRMSYQELHQRLLEQYAPPSVVINQEYEVLHLSERAGQFLQFVGGEPSQNLLKVVRPELRLELHGALYHAVHNRTSTEAVAGPVTLEGGSTLVKMTVSPVFSDLDATRGMILVLFERVGAAPQSAPARITDGTRPVEPIARQLEEELVRLKLQLRATIEQYEVQQEELKASNEELQAMNEELRSSTEELETSKEELQSANEELTTVNQELKIKIDELSHANNDTRNLMNSTDIATVFVDRALRIQLFTPRARAIFNLLPGDAGRPLLDITHRLEYPELVGDIEHVFDALGQVEREVHSSDGAWFIARVSPYRTADDHIAGVVLTFTDITRRRAAEEALRDSEEYVRLVVDSVPEHAIFAMDPAGVIHTWNNGARDVFGYDEKEAVGQHVRFLFTPEDREAGVPEEEMRLAREEGLAPDERWHLRKGGARFFVSGVVAPLRRGGALVGYTKVARDLTERRRADEALQAARADLERRVAERTAQLAQANAALQAQIEERTRAEEQRLRLLRQLVTAQEEERRRISRELHDQLGQEVTALGLQLAVLAGHAGIAKDAREQIARLQAVVKQLDSDLEFLVWELRPTGLDDLGLAEALHDYAASWSGFFNVEARLQSGLGERLRPEVETVLYRIAQEALNNVAKHAHATRVEMRLERRAGQVVLSIEDDGIGIDAAPGGREESLGFVGMRERAALVGGSVEIGPAAGKGTVLRVSVPAGD